jgi:large subunit ribosomal protein L29
MRAEEIRKYTDQEIEAMIDENESHLADLKFNNAVSPIENPAKINQVRRDIARMKTILSERQQAAETQQEA